MSKLMAEILLNPGILLNPMEIEETAESFTDRFLAARANKEVFKATPEVIINNTDKVDYIRFIEKKDEIVDKEGNKVQ